MVMMEEAQFSVQAKEIIYENTYITSPEGYGKDTKLQRHKLQEVVKSLLQERLQSNDHYYY